MKKTSLLCVMTTAALVLLTACSGGDGTASESGNAASGSEGAATEDVQEGELKEVSREKTLIWAVPELPNGADNEFQYTAEAQELERNLYDSPLAYATYFDEESGFLLPDYSTLEGSLAESWEISEDGSEVTLTFRKGVKSHAGNELTADDFIYSWERGFGDAGNKGTFGAQNMELNSADQIEKIDDYTVKITMNGPNPIAESFLAHVCGLIVDSEEYQKHATESDPWALDWASTHASGHGPWKLVEFTPGVRVVVDRFDDYWDQEHLPYFERVIILEVPESSNRASMLLTGDIDAATKLSNSEIAELQKNPAVKCLHYDGNKTFIVGFNVQNEFLSNPTVRRALGFAVPYDEILETVYLGQAKQLKSLVCSTYPMSTDQYFQYTYDLDQAKSLLEEAGYGDGFSCKITIDNTNVQAEQTALLMQSSFRQIGVELEIEKIQSGGYYDKLANKDFEGMFAFLDSAGCPDAGFALRLGARTDSINNMGHYSNPEVDELVDKMMSTIDESVREECADRLQEIVVWEDPYCLYIAEPGFDLAVTQDIENPQWDTIQQIHWKAMKRAE